MAEKQDIREDQMTVTSSVDYVRGMKGKNSVLINPNNLPHPNTGGQFISSGALIKGKWYRIAVGRDGSYPCSGYSSRSFIAKLASSSMLSVSKARVLSGKVPLVSYLDIYISASLENSFYISASCLMNFKLQTPEEVGETIPEGYSVKEVAF